MKKWENLNKIKDQRSRPKDDRPLAEKIKTDQIIKILLNNRGLKAKKEIEEFLNPKIENITINSVGINKEQLQKAIKRIQKAIKNKEQIIVFGDYDVDGICGTAILWETLNSLGAKVTPYIPHRIDEGYGLSIKGVQNAILRAKVALAGPADGALLGNKNFLVPHSLPFRHANSENFVPSLRQNLSPTAGSPLIITVDNGIVANEAVDFANKEGINVIITDHHVPPAGGTKKLPKAFAIVHTTKLCGASVAWILSQECHPERKRRISGDSSVASLPQNDMGGKHLELVALATIADLVPLIGQNRTLLTYGLKQLRKTKRVGLLELFKEAVINPQDIDVYQIGHIIAPRLNAMGRLEYAMDSLRLLCTTNKKRAQDLAQLLGSTNRERQELTLETLEHAILKIKNQKSKIKKLMFISHESYQQGVIGLVAGRLVEEFYRPAIVVSKGKKYSKASARSVHGFNIIEFIRSASEFLVDAGGHPMAAGFTVETEKLSVLQKTLEDFAEKLITEDSLIKTLRIDCELPLSIINHNLYNEIQKLAPFGMKNPEPTFLSKNVLIEDMRIVGREGKHIRFKFSIFNFQFSINGIGFGMGERAREFRIGDKVNIVYTIDEDEWNGDKRLQLKVKDLKK